MKRRDLIKSGILAAGIATIKSNSNRVLSQNISEISPKQTQKYQISCPMPFDFSEIDKLKELNSTLKKSEVKTLYNSFPAPLCYIFGGEFQTNRGFNDNIKNFDDFAKYVKYAQKSGFKFIYTLNNPKPFFEKDFEKNKDELFSLLDSLQQIGVKDIKIANQQLMDIINKQTNFKFNFHVSTSSEYHNIRQYVNLINSYPNITSINISIDDNRNFDLLTNLRKKYPNVTLEIILNESCVYGCPSRISHPSTFFEYFDCVSYCKKIGKIEYFFKSNMIYPWQLEYYSAIGINDFKLVFFDRGSNSYSQSIKPYLMCVENGIGGLTTKDFFYSVMNLRGSVKLKENVQLSEIIKYFPDIKYFIKNGDTCSSMCGIECNYCMECAKKVKKMVL